MQTPPNVSSLRGTAMQFRRAESEEEPRNELMTKFAPKYQGYRKDIIPITQRENIAKITGELKKNIAYIDSTKWMFQNNGDALPHHNITMNNF